MSHRTSATSSHSTRAYFRKLGITPNFSRPRTPNDTLRAIIEAHFGTVKGHPVYPGYFADEPAAVHYFTDFYPWYNQIHPLTTLQMLTSHQVHTGQAAALLAVRETRKIEALAQRRQGPKHPFTVEELIAQSLPDVSQLPVYSWAGPDVAPQNGRHLLRN